MRQTATGQWVAQAGDGPGNVFDHWGWGFVPYEASLNEEAGDQFMFGGQVFDKDGHAHAFDGFESVDDARTFCVSVLGVPTERVEVLEG
jgi:hypothetical protein